MSKEVKTVYRYKAIDSQGKYRRGYIKASSPYDAFDILRQRYLYPFQIKRIPWNLDNSIIKSVGKIPLRHIIIFCQQMYVVINSGIPILQALHGIYENTKHRRFKKILGDVYLDIQKGMSLSKSFEKHNSVLPYMFSDMVYAGETSGNLDRSFKYMANYYEREYTLRKKLINVLIYPIFVCILTMFLLQFLISYVTPYFIEMYMQNDEDLPKATRLLLKLHSLLGGKRYIFALITVIASIVIIVKKSKYRFHSFILRLPILGNFFTKIITIKICIVMSMLLSSGISILDSLSMTKNTIKNNMVRVELQKIQNRISQGEDILESFKASTFFPSIFIQLLSVGVVSGNIEQVFDGVAKFYEAEIEGETDRFLSVIEPVLILIVGIMVGFISYALVIPIYNLIEVL